MSDHVIELLSEKLRLSISGAPWPIASPSATSALSAIPAFEWNESEPRHMQYTRCISYLRRNLPCSPSAAHVRPRRQPARCQLRPAGLVHRHHGPMLIEQSALSSPLIPQDGVRMLLELRKDIPRFGDPRAARQAMAKLLAATMICSAMRPMLFLTDLKEYWLLLWVDGPTLHYSTVPSATHRQHAARSAQQAGTPTLTRTVPCCVVLWWHVVAQ